MITKDERAIRTYRLIKQLRRQGHSWRRIQLRVKDLKHADLERPKESRKLYWLTAWSLNSLRHQYDKGKVLAEAASYVRQLAPERQSAGGASTQACEIRVTGPDLESVTIAAILAEQELRETD